MTTAAINATVKECGNLFMLNSRSSESILRSFGIAGQTGRLFHHLRLTDLGTEKEVR